MNRYIKLLDEFRKSFSETEWVEFKENNYHPQLIGEYISALSNSASLHGKNKAFLIYGIEDKTHEIIGTSFKPRDAKGKGNEDLEPWLARQLLPRIDFRIIEFEYAEKHIVLFEIDATLNTPVSFRGETFIRVGEHKHKLSDHPEKERKIWKKGESSSYELKTALSAQSADSVIKKIDYPTFFDLLNIPLPDNKSGIIERLVQENIIVHEGEKYNITNMGAILFAKNIDEFSNLSRKAVRVIIYNGEDRLNAKKEQVGKKGYAAGFEGLIDWINDQLPSNELIEDTLRVEKKMYPKVAIREFVANAIIHQDLTISGTSPMVEVFDSRIEITNAVSPLVDVERFIDYPPKTRNEKLAALMRRMNICEERGSGVDRAVTAIEIFQLPAPIFQSDEDFTKIILFAHKDYKDMDRNDRVRACYQHACLRWVCRDFMTNASIRERMKIDKRNYPMASKIIRDTINEGVIKVSDPENRSNKKKYIPWWA